MLTKVLKLIVLVTLCKVLDASDVGSYKRMCERHLVDLE